MNISKRLWFWNVVLVLTLIFCLFTLVLHFKNWVSVNDAGITVRSGFYNADLPFTAIDSIILVERIPPMERLNGFSALEKEKGIFREFKDSLTNKKVHVFVDNINNQKLKLVYKDSFYVYLNLKDSVQTMELMETMSKKIGTNQEPN